MSDLLDMCEGRRTWRTRAPRGAPRQGEQPCAAGVSVPSRPRPLASSRSNQFPLGICVAAALSRAEFWAFAYQTCKRHRHRDPARPIRAMRQTSLSGTRRLCSLPRDSSRKARCCGCRAYMCLGHAGRPILFMIVCEAQSGRSSAMRNSRPMCFAFSCGLIRPLSSGLRRAARCFGL